MLNQRFYYISGFKNLSLEVDGSNPKLMILIEKIIGTLFTSKKYYLYLF